jgi:O-antigen ligase
MTAARARVSGWPHIAGPRQAAVVTVALLLAGGVGLLAGASPAQAIGVVGVLAFIPVVVTRYTLGVGIFVLSTFLGISGTAQKGIGFLVILVAVSITVSGRGTKSFFGEHRRETVLLLAFVGWSIVGLTWATSTGDVMYSLSRYIPNFLVFFVIYAAVRDERDVRVLAIAFVLGAVVAAGDAIVSPPASSSYGGRVGGTFGDPNELAAVLVIGFSISVTLSRTRVLTLFGQFALMAAAGMCLLGILLSVSRGGLIALVVALVAGILIGGRWRAGLVMAAAFVIIAGAGYFFILAPPAARSRLTSNTDGGSGRTTIWRVGWREVVNNPIRGVGAGNFSVAGAKYVIEPGTINHLAASYTSYFIDTPTVAHNTYLEVLAEEGIPGALMFFWLIAGLLACTWRAALIFRGRRDEQMELLCYGVFCGTIGFLAASFFLSEEYTKQLYLVLALGPALLKVARSSGPSANLGRGLGRAARGRLPAAVQLEA